MITREKDITTVISLLKDNPVVGIVGARQVGKTTLAHEIAAVSSEPCAYFDMENPEDMARFSDPMLALRGLEGLVVIDEVQMYPDIFPVLRVLADQFSGSVRFLVLGSASPHMLKQTSETLAGRIAYHELKGFSIADVGTDQSDTLWLRGSFPRSFLSSSLDSSFRWRRDFIKTYLERDLPQLGITTGSQTMRRFWTMLAHYHGQTWNASEIGRSFGVADTTVRRYLDILESTFVVRLLQPWHENISKRQVKSPKIYIADSGIFHSLLNIRTKDDLYTHPKAGASWEGFVIEQLIRYLDVYPEECFFWATHAGAELDLLVKKGRKRLGFEVKLTSSPKITPSINSALESLKLDSVFVMHAGENTFPLSEKVKAVSVKDLLTKTGI